MNQPSLNNSELPERSPNYFKSASDNSVEQEIRSVEGNSNQVVQADGSSVNQLNLQNSTNNLIVQTNGSPIDLSSILIRLAGFTNQQNNQIRYGDDLIKKGQFRQAIEYFYHLKEELWSTAENHVKYRILANIGLAEYELDNFKKASNIFVQSLQYNPEDEQALALVAMGYEMMGDRDNAKKFLQKVIDKNPSNSIANGLIVMMNSKSYPLEELITLVPIQCRDDINVLAALGNAALDKKEYSQAENWFNKAIELAEGNTKRLKLALSCALLMSFTDKVPLFLIGQFDSTKQRKLEQAVHLLTDILDNTIPNPKDLSNIHLNAIINRSSALWFLGRIEESIRDIEIALQADPKNLQLVRQYADLLYKSGKIDRAVTELKKVVIEFPNHETIIDLAALLIEQNLFREAETLLNQILELTSDLEIKTKTQQAKVSLYVKEKNYQKAEKLSKELINEEPNDIINIVQYIHIIVDTSKDDEEIQQLLNRCRDLIEKPNINLTSLYYLADLFKYLKYYRDAAGIYEKIVDTTLNNELTATLLHTYFYSGNFKSALGLCKQMLEQHGAILYVSEMASYIYQTIGNLDEARSVSYKALERFPNNISIQLGLAGINYRTGQLEALDKFLDSNPDLDNISLEGCQKIIELYKVRGKLKPLFKTLFEIRKRFFNKPQVHVDYIITYLEVSRSQAYCLEKEVVEDNCGVQIIDEFRKDSWYILDDNNDSDLARNELNSTQVFYQKLLGKKIGDKINLVENNLGFDDENLTVAAITDKYFAAYKLSFDLVEKQPGIKDFWTIRVSTDDSSEIEPEWIKRFDKMLQTREDNFQTLKSNYRDGKFPLGAFANLINKNPIELWMILINGTKPYINCWSNPNEKFDEALTQLQKGGLVVVDICSLLTLYHLEIADEVVKTLGNLGIAQTTFDILQQMVEKFQGSDSEGYSSIGMVNGQRIFYEFSPEQIAEKKSSFDKIVNWVKNNCLILPCWRALDISKEERDERSRVLGLSFVDTVMIGSEPNRILCSDDQWLRYFARTDSSMAQVWTQVILTYCLQQKSISYAKFFDSTLQLICWGYNYTRVDADMLIEGARRAKWQIQQPYTTLLEYLGNLQDEEEFLSFIATEFIYNLYKEDIIVPSRDYLILELLKTITYKKSQISVLNKLIPRIKNRLYLVPLAEEEVLYLIKIWRQTQTIQT